MSASSHSRAQLYKGRAVAGVKWTSLSTALTTGFYLLQSVVLARLLEPRDFGLMAMSTVIISIAVAYVDMGLSSAIIQRQHCSPNELSSLYWLNIFAGLVVLGLVLALAPLLAHFYHEPRVTRIIQICSLTFLISPVGAQYQLLLQKELLFRPLAVIELSSRGVGTVAAIVAAFLGAGVYSLVVGQLATSASSTTMLLVRGRHIYRPRFHFAWSDVRGYLGFGLYQMGERGLNTIHDNLDKLIIGFWLGATPLGYYNFAWNLATMPISRISPILTRTAFPLFSRLQEDIDLLRRGYLKLLRLIGITNFPLSLGLCAVAPLVVPLVFGQKWLPAVPLIQVFCFVAVLYSTGNPVGSLVLARGRARLAFWWQVAAFGVQALAVLLGAALGSLMTVAVALLLMQLIFYPAGYRILVRPVLGACWREYVMSVAPAFICSLLMLALVMLVSSLLPAPFGTSVWALLVLILLGAIVYAGAALVLLKKDIRELVALATRRASVELGAHASAPSPAPANS